MHPLQNGTQVEVPPKPKPKVDEPGYFTEVGQPSIPGADWFNANIKEFLNVLATAGITFDPEKFDHLLLSIQSIGKSAIYDELVGFILPDSTIQAIRLRAFLANGAEYNRADYPKLWSKVNGTAMLVSQSIINSDPETYAANYGDGDGSTTFTLPNYGLRPHLAAAGAFGTVGSTKEDQIQNITGSTQGLVISGSGATSNINFSGALVGSPQSVEPIYGATISTARSTFSFDASRVARTSNYTETNSSFLNFYIIHGETA